MIKASIYRTDPDQIAEKGVTAWAGMNFTAEHTTVGAVWDYCHQLAAGDRIRNPAIVLSTDPIYDLQPDGDVWVVVCPGAAYRVRSVEKPTSGRATAIFKEAVL